MNAILENNTRALVTFDDGKSVRIVRLFSRPERQFKLAKGLSLGWYTLGLSLAPARVSGRQTCGSDTAGCRRGCIFTAGNGFFPKVWQGRVAKTILYFNHRNWFVDKLKNELAREEIKAKTSAMMLCVRLNVFSDLAWEKKHADIFRDFSDTQFYDYTKHESRMLSMLTSDAWPANYHLTFSRSERNESACKEVLRLGGNVTVVFRKQLPAKYWGREVLDGDETDLRFLDKRGGFVIGLKAKGKGRNDQTGFVVD